MRSSLLAVLCTIAQLVIAQEIKIHSHNDYLQNVPFWEAYANGLQSIEVDIFLKDDILYAAHGESDIIRNRTLENLYLQPLRKASSLQLGEVQKLQLLVDIKSEARSTLGKLVAVLEGYPDIIHNPKISIVISGNRPEPKAYARYPDYILFDYQQLEDMEDKAYWDKVALISLNLKNFSRWNGKGRFTAADLENVRKVVQLAHSRKKPFRFWATPDSKTAWKALSDLGVDYINTDMPYACSAYLKTLGHRVYTNTLTSKVYVPSYVSDQGSGKVQNLILLIGDGNGLSQISAATLANGGNLTLTQFKSIGLLKTQSADDFTTDSAAGATALATGQKTNNRAIGTDSQGNPLENITEILKAKGFNSGCITTDHIAGATPASFYAHRTDRSETEGILSDLSKSKLSLLIGGGSTELGEQLGIKGFSSVALLGNLGKTKADKVVHFLGQGGVPSVRKGRGPVLKEATQQALAFLKSKKRPFFLLVEGAQIDSYGHAKDTGGIVTEGIDFDKAVGEALKFADADGQTLVLVTADHETGGFSIPQGSLKDKTIEGDFTTHDHTGAMIPIFAYGPGSQYFQGVYGNNTVFDKMLEALEVEKNR
ncbi:MAG: alkaline phosphatase [Bacteroidota bacterium]